MARSLKKGFFVDPKLMDRVLEAQRNDSRKGLNTWSRRSTITPDFVGLTINVHNGHTYAVLERIDFMKTILTTLTASLMASAAFAAEPLVDNAWLKSNLNDENLVIFHILFLKK